MTQVRQDLTRSTLAVLCILGLIGLSLWILRPFLAAAVWATMIVVATWPLFLTLETRLGQRRLPAVMLISAGLLLVLVLPLWLAISTIGDHVELLASAGQSLATNGLPLPPQWVAGLPLIGVKISEAWRQAALGGSAGLLAKLTPYAADAGKWLLAEAGGLGGMLVQFLLVVAIAAVFYAGGEAAARLALRFGRRLAGERGEKSIILAAQAIRGVALGVGVTALVQALLGALGLAVAGVPFAALLAALMLMLCVAQVGPLPVLLPAAGWLYWQGEAGWAIGLLMWSVLVGSLDSFLRPALIRRGADLPLLLIFVGVIGGLLGFGLVGIFVGPVVLAVTYTLLLAWLEDGLGQDAPVAGEDAPRPAASAPPEPDHSEPAAG